MKSRSFNLFVILALFLSLLGSAVTVTPAYAAGIVVNTNADNTTEDDLCSLREAITTANTDAAINPGGAGNDCTTGAGSDTITFATGLSGATITLNSTLPTITNTLTIDGSALASPITISGNNAVQVMVNSISLTLDTLTIANGVAALYGGGIFNLGILTVTNSTFSGNSASFGGGIFNGGILTVTNSTFSGNQAGSGGGGISNDVTRTATVTNSTFSGNSASNFGGGIATGPLSTFTITNSTFSGNSASTGGGIWHNGTLNFANTIIANSTSGGDCATPGLGSIVTNTNNLVEDGSCSTGGILFKTGDPNLGSPADNGGPTQTMALQSPSTAIDAGDAATCTSIGNKDQRGVTRPIDGDAVAGAICDIGAFEYGAIIPIVTASNPSANAVLTSLISINVVFNQDMKNDGSAEAANNTANYILVERGANGSFDTTSCNGGVASDDAPQTINTAGYNSAGFITTLTLASPLAAGTYRLFVCGTTSVWSVAGLELNNGASDYTVDFTITAAAGTGTGTGSGTTSTTASSLPKTGFASNKITSLPAQPADLAYAKLGDLWLEIPSLNVKSTIVGVPQNADKTWDVSWLGNDTGWLNGTAFPTWNGNSVLTAHVTNASGLDGPFAALKSLKYGDQVIVHFGGVKYIYEVRITKLARPYTTNFTFESKSDASYLTLVTCSGYNPLNESYIFRRVVRAVLVSTISE